MRIHKEIKIDMDVIQNVIQHKNLIKRAVYNIEQYNKRKETEIFFSFTGSCSRAAEWGYLLDTDINWLDNYFIKTLGMEAITKASWDNKTAERIYFFEE